MAKYDKRILDPYLSDVYSVELLRYEVQRYHQELLRDISMYRSKLIKEAPPIEPEIIPSRYGFIFLAGALASTAATIFLFSNDDSFFRVLLGLAGVFVSFALWECTYNTFQMSIDSKDKYDAYLDQLDVYTSRSPVRIGLEQELYRLENEEATFEDRMEHINQLRDDVYSANIIPLKYRNIYAAHFLYQYFTTSDANDIDMILQTFVLEEIKDRLDDIIEQQTEMILNQRTMIAYQEAATSAMARHHEQQMKQIASLNENAQNQTKYLQMINANLAVSNYFTYKDYIKH